MTNSLPDYERWAELEEQIAEAKRENADLLMGYKRRGKEILSGLQKEAELETDLEEARSKVEAWQSMAGTLYRDLAEKQEEINRLRAIPLPPEPDLYDPGWKTWRDCVQHYEAHLGE